MLLVIGVLSAVTTLSVPLYRTYQARSDLNIATEQTIQGLARAKLLSQNGEKDASWGFFVPAGTLYEGNSYAERDQRFDEMYPMPSTVTVSGSILEVSYSKLEGRPSATGSIILTAVDGEQRVIVIQIAIQTEGVAANPGDTITICHVPGTARQQTMTIVDSSWPSYQSKGDTLGACPGSSSSAQSSFALSSSSGMSVSSSSMSASSSGTASSGGSQITICHKPGTAAQQTFTVQQSAWSGHQKHGDTMGACSSGAALGSLCPSRFTFEEEMEIVPSVSLGMTAKALGSQLTYGQGGPTIPVTVSYTSNDGKKWTALFNGASITPGLTQTVSSIPSGSEVAFQFHAYFKQRGWLTYDETAATNDGSDHTVILRRGDPLPPYLPYAKQQSLQTILANYLDADKKLTIDPSALILLVEFSTIDYPAPSTEDFQDAVLLVQFTGTPSCP